MKTINRRSRLTLLGLLSASIWLAGCSTPARVPLPDNDTLKAGHQAALTLADLPLDFDPEEATEIAEELLAAAEAARAISEPGGKKGKGKPRR